MTQQSHYWAYTLRKLHFKRHMYPNVHCSIIYKGQQPRYPLTDEWIKKMWYIYAMKYYSAVKRNSGSEVDEPRACYTVK